MKRIVFCLFLSAILAISCGKDNHNPDVNIDKNIHSENTKPSSAYFLVQSPDSNLILKYKALPTGSEELELSSLTNDKISNIKAKQWDTLRKGSIILEYSIAKSAEYKSIISEFEAASKNYELAKKQFNDEDISKQVLENIQTQYLLSKRKYDAIQKKINIEAPFDCIVKKVLVRNNDKVQIGQALIQIAKIDTVKAKILINDYDRQLITKQTIPEILLNDNSIIKGKIQKIIKSMNNDQSFEADINFPNIAKKINIKDSIEITIDTKTKNKRILIPKNAIKIENDTYVMILLNDASTQKRIVKLGNIIGDKIEVLSGLNSGDKVSLE